ncbi:uncharacterized protein LOC122004585 [Zingiber officinale]|uniref:uncharacterized protein LOC122004585 n=1 Tax=Zingiber officinale TaxID=94328 RepID=UPI001C4B3BB7|nr:uncharacterized protein LOC122004585 [Zingiber officinale]
MRFVDSSVSLLATCGSDTVKLFDVTVDVGDPYTLSYTLSPGSQINSVKWNHTNLVVASAGDDKKISLWNKNGQSMGSFPSHGSDLADDIEESKTQLLIWCHAKNIHSCYVGYNNSAKCILRWTPSHFSNCCQCLGQCHSCFYFLIGNCTEDGKAQLEDCKREGQACRGHLLHHWCPDLHILERSFCWGPLLLHL